MTNAQEKTIQAIKEYIEKHDMYNDDAYEIKKFEVKETDYGAVIVYAESGRKNDEGTMAALLCRRIRHIFIGVRGGVKSSKYDKGKSKDLKGWSNVMIYGYRH